MNQMNYHANNNKINEIRQTILTLTDGEVDIIDNSNKLKSIQDILDAIEEWSEAEENDNWHQNKVQ